MAGTSYKVSLAEAVQFAKSQNKWLLAANIGQEASAEDRKDAYRNALPTVNASASYQRFSGLTLFTEGLNHTNTASRKPSSNSIDMNQKLNEMEASAQETKQSTKKINDSSDNTKLRESEKSGHLVDNVDNILSAEGPINLLYKMIIEGAELPEDDYAKH